MQGKAQLGFGSLRLPQCNGRIEIEKLEELFAEYMKGDFCFFDLHPSYAHGQAQRILKEFVVKKYPRNTFFLANKMPYYGISDYADYAEIFSQELTDCGVDYFDYYMLHALTRDSYLMHEKFGGFRFLKECKEKGQINKLGISFHDKPELLEEILTKHPEIEFVLLQINFLDWESPVICSRHCYEIARRFHKQILVMEPIKGGTLTREIKVLGKSLSASELAKVSLRFVASLPGISVILSGMASTDQIEENRKSLDDNTESIDSSLYHEIIREINKVTMIPCTSCGYCIRECWKNIAIPEMISLLNSATEAKKINAIFAGQALYKGIVFGKGSASSCIGCGRCELRCPQKINIRKFLKDVAREFERVDHNSEEKVELDENSLELLRNYLKNKEEREIVAWGAGVLFGTYLPRIEEYVKIRYVCDGDSTKWGKEIAAGVVCIPPKQLSEMKSIFVLITVDREEVVKRIADTLTEMGISSHIQAKTWLDYMENNI